MIFWRQAYCPWMGLISARLETAAAWSLSPGLWNCSPQGTITYCSTRTAQTPCVGLRASVRLICSASAEINADSAAGKTALSLCCTARRGVSGKAFFFYIKGVPDTSALTWPDPAQLHTYSEGACTSSENSHWCGNDVCREKGSGFSHPTDNDLLWKIKGLWKNTLRL